MQFSKTSKKTRTLAEEAAAAPEIATQAEASQPRTTRSSKSKSSEGMETGSAKHRKSATKSNAGEQFAPAVEGRGVSAAPGASQTFATETTERLAPVAEQTSNTVSKPGISHYEIAALAHSYWVDRGYAPGSPEQDWLRAERELKA
jgi:hypothetical protein